jgi:hypothetical protein
VLFYAWEIAFYSAASLILFAFIHRQLKSGFADTFETRKHVISNTRTYVIS